MSSATELSAFFERALALHAEDKTIQANNFLQTITKGLERYDEEHQSDSDKAILKKVKEQIKTNPIVAEIQAVAEKVYKLRSTLSSDEGWQEQSNVKGARTLVYERGFEGGLHIVRVEGYVEAPLLHILAVLAEIDLWPGRLMPNTAVVGLKEGKRLAQPRPTFQLCTLHTVMPWPVAHRDAYFTVRAVDCMDDDKAFKRQIVLLVESCSEFPGVEIPTEADTGFVRANLTDSGVILTPEVDEKGLTNRTFVQFVSRADPKLAYVPHRVVDLFTRNLIYYFLPSLRSQAQDIATDPNSIYWERMRSNDALYGFLERRSKECFPANRN